MSGEGERTAVLIRWHMKLGWWGLFTFVLLGIVLESLHGFKVGWYVDAMNETRRLMWTLAHAHGTLMSLLHLAFALTARTCPRWSGRSQRIASVCLSAAALTLPLGFLLGGVFVHGGDPGLGIVLVPPSGVLLLIALAATAVGAGRGSDPNHS
ncbi:MAG: hypothetical protein KDC87_09855 [Planctomycetes bacterium]|nr:hypothetical protein [Planctomycetota bacterium]